METAFLFKTVPIPSRRRVMSRSPSSIGLSPPNYQLPEETRLGQVRLQISDLSRSLAFYQEHLGFHVLDRNEKNAVLGPQKGNEPLIELHEGTGVEPIQPRERLGLFHVAFLLPERAALGRLVRHLLETKAQPGMSDHLVSEAIYVTDPDGLGLEIYADRPRTKWTVSENGQVEMATKPLDTADLIETAGKTSWTGIPEGTTVGHVHLHVGDLKRASTFYHEGLGFDKTVWSFPGALFFSAGGYHHHLGTNVWAGDVPPPSKDEAQLLEWRLLLPDEGDVLAAAKSVEAEGYAARHDADTRIAEDPWGTSVRIASAE